ncbi:PKD domain-containing protein [uncultured Deinococcus sp.]|uniref:PKD domain-containing protein n=1 Tax=uncultured Deinococcus sp. TaxID=158789 RepID=UPI0025EEC3CB|nr:PKD domain-containing protein [uncultured Deinococcus sp.]
MTLTEEQLTSAMVTRVNGLLLKSNDPQVLNLALPGLSGAVTPTGAALANTTALNTLLTTFALPKRVQVTLRMPLAVPTLELSHTTRDYGMPLTATAGNPPANSVYRWGDGTPDSPAAGPAQHTYAASGPYTIQLRAADGTVLVSVPVTITTPVVGTTWQEPIVITDATPNKVITGAYQSTGDPTIPAIKIDTTQPVTVEDYQTRSTGLGITSRKAGNRITVRRGIATGLNPNVRGRAQDRAIDIQYSRSFLVEHITVRGTAGIYVNRTSGMTDADSKVIRCIRGIDINGQYSDGNGGYLTGEQDFFRAQLVQLNNLSGVSPLLEWLHYSGTARQSHIEDVINIHACVGKSAAERIRVRNVLIDGAFAWKPEASYTGGGVMFGDGGGQHQESDLVIVVQASNYGLAAADGNYLRHKNFLVLGSGRLADGTLLDKETDAGIYARDYDPSTPRDAATVEFMDGVVGWGNPSATNANARWDASVKAALGVMVRVTFDPAGAISEARMQQGRDLFAQRVLAAGVTIGHAA